VIVRQSYLFGEADNSQTLQKFLFQSKECRHCAVGNMVPLTGFGQGETQLNLLF
jgi:hypothetical protein